MINDELYYTGCTHRPYYPPRPNKAKRQQMDPNDLLAQHLTGQNSDGNVPSATDDQSSSMAPNRHHNCLQVS